MNNGARWRYEQRTKAVLPPKQGTEHAHLGERKSVVAAELDTHVASSRVDGECVLRTLRLPGDEHAHDARLLQRELQVGRDEWLVGREDVEVAQPLAAAVRASPDLDGTDLNRSAEVDLPPSIRFEVCAARQLMSV